MANWIKRRSRHCVVVVGPGYMQALLVQPGLAHESKAVLKTGI